MTARIAAAAWRSARRPRRAALRAPRLAAVVALALTAALAAGETRAEAGPSAIALESHVGDRTATAERFLGPVLDALADAEVGVGATGVGAPYAAAVSRPVGGDEPGAVRQFASLLEDGQTAWFDARVDDTVKQLTLAITLAAESPGLVLAPEQRRRLFQAQVTLALAHDKAGRRGLAEQKMEAVVRSFPDLKLDRTQFGPAAEGLHDRAARAVSGRAPGTLEIVAGGKAQLYVDERLVGIGEAKLQLPPGEYRVIARGAGANTRAYPAVVTPGGATRVAPTVDLDAALRTSPVWAGLSYPNPDTRAARDLQDAAAIAGALGAGLAIVLRFEERDELAVLAGTVVDAASGEIVRRADLPLGPVEPDIERLRGFAGELLGAAPAAAPPSVARADAPRPRRIAPWLLVGAGGAALVAAAVLFTLDEGPVQDGATVAVYRDTTPAALGVAAAGVGLAVVGGVWLARGGGRGEPTRRTAAAPTVVPVAGGLVLGVAGAL